MRKAFVGFIAALAVVSQGVRAEEIKFGAMPLGSIWYVFAASFAKHIQPALPAGAKVDIIARGGGIGNPIIVNEKKADVALANVCTSVWAMEGDAEIYKGKKYPDIRALLGGLNEVWLVGMLTEDYIKRTGNDTMEKALTSKQPPRIIMKPAGQHGAARGAHGDRGRGPRLRQVQGEGRPDHPGRRRPDPADDARRPRRPLLRDRASPGHPATAEVIAHRAGALRRPAGEVARAHARKNGLKVHPMPAVLQGPERRRPRRPTSAPT